jgi:ABC-2 type transport system ATP-binding protein
MTPGADSPGETSIISVRDVTKTYAHTEALRGIDLDVPAGAIVGLIGPSGCGKTTLVRLATGIEHPTTGSLEVFGEDPTGFDDATRSRLGYMPQKPTLFPHLSVWRNLDFVASLYGLARRRRRRRLVEVLDLVDMSEHRHKRLVDCSGGMQRRVSLAATLVHDPDLIVLDEPTAGIDPLLRERFWAHFRELSDRGATLVVPTQYVGEASSCDLVAVMASGRLLTVQPPDRLAREAFGGRPMRLELDGGWLPPAEVERIAHLRGVAGVHRVRNDLVLGVVDADLAAVSVSAHLHRVGGLNVTLEDADLSADDVFVALVESRTSRSERSMV